MSDASQKGIENEKLSTALNEIFSNPQMLSAISSMAKNLKDGDHSSVTAEKKRRSKGRNTDRRRIRRIGYR